MCTREGVCVGLRVYVCVCVCVCSGGWGLQCTGFRNWTREDPLMKSRHSRELVRARDELPSSSLFRKDGHVLLIDRARRAAYNQLA